MDSVQLAALQLLVSVLAQQSHDAGRRAVRQLIQIAASDAFDRNLLVFAERANDTLAVFAGEEMGRLRKILA